jgi:hypothetical protein
MGVDGLSWQIGRIGEAVARTETGSPSFYCLAEDTRVLDRAGQGVALLAARQAAVPSKPSPKRATGDGSGTEVTLVRTAWAAETVAVRCPVLGSCP